MSALKTLPREAVLRALDILGFVEFELRDTHVKLWTMRDGTGGSGAIVRVPGFARVPPIAQATILDEGKISVGEWLAAVADALQLTDEPEH